MDELEIGAETTDDGAESPIETGGEQSDQGEDTSSTMDHMEDGERDAASKIFGEDATRQILSGEKPKQRQQEAPAGFTKETKEIFLKAPPEVQAEMLKAYKDMQRDYTQKVASVKAIQSVPPEEQEAFARLLGHEEARKAMLWIDSDPEVAQYVTDRVREFVEARNSGKPLPSSAPSGAPVDTSGLHEQLTPFLEELDGVDDDELPEMFLSNPQGLRAIVRAAAGLSAQLEEVKKLVQPVQNVAGKVEQMEERGKTMDALISKLPENERAPEFLNRMADVLDEKEGELEGMSLEARFKVALEAVRGEWAARAAEQRGKVAAQAQTKAPSLVGLPVGGNRTAPPSADDDESRIFKRWSTNQGPFDVPEE